MKSHKHTSTSASSLNNSRLINPPLVMKEIIRVREPLKHSPPPPKVRYKTQYDFQIEGQIQHNEVNWVIYNILASIYHNWLRLAPYILHLLKATQRDKIKDINEIIRRIREEEQKIRKNLALFRTKRMQGHRKTSSQLHYVSSGNCFDETIRQALRLFPQVHMSTQLLNSYMLSKNRRHITTKENHLTDHFLKKNQTRENREMVFLDAALKNVADTLLDRIEHVRYLHENRLKVEDDVSHPIRKLFELGIDLNENEHLSTEKIIETIRANIQFKKLPSDRNIEDRRKEFVMNSPMGERERLQIELLDRQTERMKGLEDKKKQCSSELQNDNKSGRSLETYERSHKKIKFKISEDSKEEEVEAPKKNKNKKNLYQIYKERKVVLNKEKIKNNQQSLKKLKSENKKTDQKGKDANGNPSASQDPKKGQKTAKANRKKTEKDQLSHEERGNRKTKKVTYVEETNELNEQYEALMLRKKTMARGSIRDSRDSQFSFVSQGQNESDAEFFSRSRPLKAGRLRRLRQKQTTGLYQKLSIDALDRDLNQEDNVVQKKKKILNFINKLESEGIFKQSEMKKIIMMAKRINAPEEQAKKPFRKVLNRPGIDALPQDYGVSNPKQLANSLALPEDECLYGYLMKLHEDAVKHWGDPNPFGETQKQEDMQIHKRRGSNMHLDLPEVKYGGQEVIYNYRWFDKESNALAMSLMLAQEMNQAVGQKSIEHRKSDLI